MAAPPGVPPAPAGTPGAERAPAPAAPAVVAVMVTSDAGPWLEEALAALGAQDYPNLSVLVVDAGSTVDPTPRVAAVLPSAYVRRLDANAGYGPSANDVLEVVEGASHFVFLHDDAAPDPDAVRLMVEEAYRSNAGVVAPKLVAWDDPRRILAVGAGADKTGVVHHYGRGELDQEQHDAVRDVFLAPGGCTLVRADLFSTIGGFDPGQPMMGEDLDLCWRAHVVGARVVVAPAARVRHREATAEGERPLGARWAEGGGLDRLTLRHRVRTVAKAYALPHLAAVLPQLVVGMVLTALLARLSGRRRPGGSVGDALRWNLRRRAELRSARHQLKGLRTLRDLEVRRLQSRSSGGRLATAVRTVVAGEQRGGGGVASAGRRVAGTVTGEGARQRVLITLGLGLVLLVGSRQLLSGRLPAVGQLAPFPDGPGAFLRLFASGWRSSGLGSEAPAPFAFALLGVGGVVALGAMDLLQKVLVLGMIPLGVVGAHRLAAPIGSWRGRALSAVLYAAVPLPYDALAAGRWAGLVAYGVAPWLLSRLLRATGLEPFGAPARPELLYRRRREDSGGREGLREGIDEVLGAEAATLDAVSTEELRVAAAAMVGRRDEPDGRTDRRRPVIAPAVLLGRPPGPLPRQALAAALLVAVAAAFAPALAAATVLVGLGLVLSSALAGGLRAMARALGVAGGAVLGAGLLLMPWTLELVLPGAGWAGFTGLGRPASAAPGLAEIVRFGTGPVGSSPLNWGLILVAGLPLAVGRRWRFSWSTRLWVVALACWGVAWAAGRGWLGIPPPPVDVLLAPAAAALVLCAALGQAAYERDLSRFRFGLRQLGFVGAALAAVSTTLPVVAAALDGRWNLPRRDLATLVSWMPERRSEGSFRVLWAGEPGALPLDGWALDGGLAYGTSRGGPPGATDLWPASDSGATGLLADSLAVARRGETTTLGHLLGPLGVRFVAVPSTAAPGEDDPPSRSPGLLDLLAAMRSQTDLKLVQSDPALVVYENVAWAPAASVLGDQAAAASEGSGLDVARTTDLRGSAPALVERGPTRHTGEVAPGPVYLAEAYSERWALTVGSDKAEQRKAFGWASLFSVRDGGQATLRYRTSPVRWLAILVELALWLAVVVAVVRGRRDGARAPAEDSPPARPLAAPAVTAGSWGRP